SAANSSKRACSRSRKRNRTRARSTAGVSLQAGSASAAQRTVRSISSAVQKGTWACTPPVEGLKTSPRRSLAELSQLPRTRKGMVADMRKPPNPADFVGETDNVARVGVSVIQGVIGMARIVRGGLIQATICEPATSAVAKIKQAMIEKHEGLIAA